MSYPFEFPEKVDPAQFRSQKLRDDMNRETHDRKLQDGKVLESSLLVRRWTDSQSYRERRDEVF